MAIHDDAAPADDAARPDAPPPDAPPDEQVARKEASMKPIFNTGRGRGTMLATAVAPAAAAHV